MSYASPSYWGSALTGAFGYRVSKGEENDSRDLKRVGVERVKGKGKERMSLPEWNEEVEDKESGEVEKEDEASLRQDEEDEGTRELNELVDTILYKVSRNLYDDGS